MCSGVSLFVFVCGECDVLEGLDVNEFFFQFFCEVGCSCLF